MEESEVTTISSEYIDYDPTTYSDELQELINQGREIINQSSECLQQNADSYAAVSLLVENLQTVNERDESLFCGIVVIVAALGVLSGLIISLLIKVR